MTGARSLLLRVLIGLFMLFQLGCAQPLSREFWGFPHAAENGDVQGADNDGDGRVEPTYVRGYYRADGTYVRSHYRALPSSSGTVPSSTSSGTVPVSGYYRKNGTYVAPHYRSAPKR